MPIDDDVKTAVGAASQAVGTAAQIARSILERARLPGDQLEIVTYEVELHDLDGDEHQDWRVRRLHLSEGLSQCYEATLDLLNTNATVNSDELLGQKLTLHVSRGAATERLVHGIIHRVDYIGISAEKLLVRIQVVPAFRLLAHRVDCRIFQDHSVPEILETVISTGLGAFEREVDLRGGLTSDERENHYPKRDYCVQYEESDLDFVIRLMEEEGIAYFFEHDAGSGDRTKELLVLVDQVGDNPNAGCPEVDIIDPDGSGEVPIIPDRPDTADTESIQLFDWSLPKQTLKVHARGFNWKAPNPDAPPEGNSEEEDAAGGGAAEWEPELYVYGDRRKIVDAADDENFNGTGIEEFGEAAVRRLDLFRRQTQLGKGGSNVVSFSPGYWFKLREHTHDGVNDLQEFLLTRVIHTGDCPDVERQDTSSAKTMGPRYTNTFECIPRGTKFRPAIVTPKPRIYGPQTAIVTGSGSEEIHTDQHGRIKVRFHWDRISALDDTASCWVRVAQSWAGPGWGSLFIPRVGMEVVVEFLHGNPDCPLVTGCVYNGTHPPPYALPDEKTKSTIKTESSPGGGGFNEIRFEDAKGSEEIFTHAQKDYNEVVKNNHTTRVGANQTNTVGGNQTQSVEKDQTETVTGEQKMTVKKNRTVTIEGSQAVTIKGAEANSGVSGSKLSITGDYKVDASNTIEMIAPTHMKLTVGGSSIFIEPGKITIAAGGKAKLVLDANALMESSAGSQVKLDGNALTCAQGGGQVKLTADVVAQASGGAQVKLDGDAKMSGGEVTVGSTDGGSLTLTADAELGGANVSVSGTAKVGIAAPAVSSAASGSNQITGGVVKIN
jgi:type VI secretion system secreted protein VgrG